jgi:hypothetical protein
MDQRREAQRRASAAYRQRVLNGADAAEFTERFRTYAKESARRRYQTNEIYRDTKKAAGRMRYYYDDSYGQFLLAIRNLFKEK